MKWTKEKPTTTGFYWFRGKVQQQHRAPAIEWRAFIHSIVITAPEDGYAEAPDACFDFGIVDLKMFDGEWAGPISEPEE